MDEAPKLTELKEFRKNHEPPLSLQGLGDMLGVSKTAVSRWETGQRKVDPDLVPMVSEKTGIPAATLRPDLAETFSESSK